MKELVSSRNYNTKINICSYSSKLKRRHKNLLCQIAWMELTENINVYLLMLLFFLIVTMVISAGNITTSSGHFFPFLKKHKDR